MEIHWGFCWLSNGDVCYLGTVYPDQKMMSEPLSKCWTCLTGDVIFMEMVIEQSNMVI